MQTQFHGRILKQREVSGHLLMEGEYGPEFRVAKHSHVKANFCIALEGSCAEEYGARTREYRPLTVNFLPAGQSHSLAISGKTLRCFTVDLEPNCLKRASEYSMAFDTSMHCHDGKLARLFLRVYEEFHQPDKASALSIEGLLLEMLAHASRRRAFTEEKRIPAWLNQTRDLLHARFPEHLTLVEIAAEVGVHPVHLAREFRRHHHATIGQYVRRLRVEYACRELSNSNEPLVEIATSAGFFDQSHFSRTFKSLLGITPHQYRIALRRR